MSHAVIKLIYHICRIFHLFGNRLGISDNLFISDGMLDRRPKVHRYRSELNLDLDIFFGFREEYGDLQYDVQASVTVILRMSYIIFDIYDFDIILFFYTFGNLIYVVNERTYFSES